MILFFSNCRNLLNYNSGSAVPSTSSAPGASPMYGGFYLLYDEQQENEKEKDGDDEEYEHIHLCRIHAHIILFLLLFLCVVNEAFEVEEVIHQRQRVVLDREQQAQLSQVVQLQMPLVELRVGDNHFLQRIIYLLFVSIFVRKSLYIVIVLANLYYGKKNFFLFRSTISGN